MLLFLVLCLLLCLLLLFLFAEMSGSSPKRFKDRGTATRLSQGGCYYYFCYFERLLTLSGASYTFKRTSATFFSAGIYQLWRSFTDKFVEDGSFLKLYCCSKTGYCSSIFDDGVTRWRPGVLSFLSYFYNF